MENSLLRKRIILGNESITDFANRANILLCSDKNVTRGLGVTLVSLLENVKMSIAVHIGFNGELPKKEEEKFRLLADKYQVPIIFYWIDDSQLSKLYSHSFINQTSYYRLLLPYVLIQYGIEKCLYLDTDILCVRDIGMWYQSDLKNKIAYVTKDATSKEKLREKVTCKQIGMKGTQYFNAGILLLNISEYVKADIGNRAVALCQKRNFGAMDQDVLNILLEGHVIFDDTYAYNCGLSVRNNEVPSTIYLIHFTGAKKPWKLCSSLIKRRGIQNLFNCHSWKSYYYELWRKYALLSPWKEEPFEEPCNHREWRYTYTMYFQTGHVGKAIEAFGKFLQTRAAEKRKTDTD